MQKTIILSGNSSWVTADREYYHVAHHDVAYNHKIILHEKTGNYVLGAL